MQLTKQGVRNLDVLPGRSSGVRLMELPIEQLDKPKCRHTVKVYFGDVWVCDDCGWSGETKKR